MKKCLKKDLEKRIAHRISKPVCQEIPRRCVQTTSREGGGCNGSVRWPAIMTLYAIPSCKDLMPEVREDIQLQTGKIMLKPGQ